LRKGFAKSYGIPAGKNINWKNTYAFKNIAIAFVVVIFGIFYLGYSLNLFLMALSPEYSAKFANAMHGPFPQAIILSLIIVGVFLFFRFARLVRENMRWNLL
jgi:hypothetical protein